MEEKLSDILDNILGLLLLEGSYEIAEEEEGFFVSIDTKDAGRLIGARGEFLESLQLLVNQMMSPRQKEGEPALSEEEKSNGFKRVVLDVSGWRKQKEEELNQRAKEWGREVLDSGKEMELEPMSSWQRRVIHMVIGELKGLETESVGEGRDRHIMIKLKAQNSNVKTAEV
ncbi:MAG: spoIIIJ-associated protein [Microgenomates group bacterium Gr01-1014_7]|nr:MAG: spoIIIJ-associated protein [Microgenomates group bacterium Gr01-1014_7]